MEGTARTLRTLEHGLLAVQATVPLRGVGCVGGLVWQAGQERLRHVDGSASCSTNTAFRAQNSSVRIKPSVSRVEECPPKLLAADDEDGLLCDLVLCAGNFHALTAARLMLESFRCMLLLGDKGGDSWALRQETVDHGANDRVKLRAPETRPRLM